MNNIMQTNHQTEHFISENDLSVYSDYPRAAYFIRRIYEANLDALHGKPIPISEWRSVLEQNDSDEIHFLILDQSIPCAWLKINELDHPDTAWISMLAVLPGMQRKGIGTFALGYAEQYLIGRGKKNIHIRTTQDNLPAQALYRKCGYRIIDDGSYTTADGVERKGLVFAKKL